MFALSVSISTSSSPTATSSPTCFSQVRIVPSSIESERRGMTISLMTNSRASLPARRTRDARLVAPRSSGEGEGAEDRGGDPLFGPHRRQLELLGVGQRHLGHAEALDRGVEVVEAGELDAGGELGGDPVGGPALLDT